MYEFYVTQLHGKWFAMSVDESGCECKESRGFSTENEAENCVTMLWDLSE